MRTLVFFLVAGLASGRPREIQDRLHPEEIKQILGLDDEEVTLREGGHYVHPAPFDAELRHVAAGYGLNIGPYGTGLSAGVGNGGINYNGAIGVGNFQNYPSPNHFTQYYQQGRTIPLSHGFGWNIGPVGAGHHVGIGNKQLGWSGGFGLQDNYARYSDPKNYNRYWRPIFHTSELL